MVEIQAVTAPCPTCGETLVAEITTTLAERNGSNAVVSVKVGAFHGCEHAAAISVEQCDEPESLLGVTPPESD